MPPRNSTSGPAKRKSFGDGSDRDAKAAKGGNVKRLSQASLQDQPHIAQMVSWMLGLHAIMLPCLTLQICFYDYLCIMSRMSCSSMGDGILTVVPQVGRESLQGIRRSGQVLEFNLRQPGAND